MCLKNYKNGNFLDAYYYYGAHGNIAVPHSGLGSIPSWFNFLIEFFFCGFALTVWWMLKFMASFDPRYPLAIIIIHKPSF